MQDAPGRAGPVGVRGRDIERSVQFSPVWDWRSSLVAVPLVLIVVAAFFPALENDFVNWDDDKNFLNNSYYRGLGWAQLEWAWSTFWLGVYQPLAWMLFEVQYAFWKLGPRGYHLTSLILHAGNTVVLYFLTLSLLDRCQTDSSLQSSWMRSLGAGLATALFAVHPLRVEAVAWASCQPYLPCALVSMLAVLAYLHAFSIGSSPDRRWLVGSFALFVAALLFHAVAVSLPLVLLILDGYPLRRFGAGSDRWLATRRTWNEKAPFVIVSLIFMAVAIVARRQSLAAVEPNALSASIARACFGVCFYFYKTVLPLDLMAVYPAPRTLDWLRPPFIQCILGTLIISTCARLMRRRWPALLAAWLIYLVILAPNSGIIRINDQLAADRYSYLSMPCWSIVLAAGFCRLWPTTPRGRAGAIGTFAVALLLLGGLIALTRDQCRTWRDSEALWAHALKHGAAESALAHFNFALVMYRQGKFDAAAAHDAKALRLNPDDVVVHNNLGVVLQRQGKLEAAAARFADAVRINPDYLDAHYNLGIVLSRQGKFEEAAGHYARALRINPRFSAAHNNLGVDLFRQGKFVEAKAQYSEALRLDPDRADTHTNLGVLLSRQGDLEQAAIHYTAALRLDPGYSEARRNLEVDRARRMKLNDATAP